ncbi:MAG: sulfite exporter TauE/SafE family protein [Alphaproteobacteria bacterium]
MITEPLFYLIAVPAILVAGISKGGFGGGVGLLAVPAMALVVPPLQAAGIMLPLLCLMDLFGLHAYRGSWDRPNMAVILPAALSGIALGTLSAGVLEEHHIRLLVGVIAVSFTADHWLGRRGREAARPRNLVKGGLWGVVSGFTSFLAHAGGPPISVYLLPLRLDKTVFVGTTVVYFAAVNYAKLAPYAWLGQLGPVNLMTALVLSPLAPVGIWLGLWLHTRISPELFYKVCYSFVFVAGCKLLYDGLAPSFGGA